MNLLLRPVRVASFTAKRDVIKKRHNKFGTRKVTRFVHPPIYAAAMQKHQQRANEV